MRYEAHNLIRDKVHVEQEQPQATTPDDPKSMYYIRLRVAEKAQRIQTTPKQRTHRHKTPVIPRGVFPPVSQRLREAETSAKNGPDTAEAALAAR